MGKFNKGFLLGGLLGAVAIWLNMTTQGKKSKAKLMKATSEIYEQVEKELEKRGIKEKITKSKYSQIVKKKVNLYAKKHQIAGQMGKVLVKMVNSKWSKLKTNKK